MECVIILARMVLYHVQGSELETFPAALHGPMMFVVRVWTRQDCDTEYGQNAWICLCHETVILTVVGRLVNPKLGCKDIKWSDICPVRSVILFVQLCNCIDMRTCN